MSDKNFNKLNSNWTIWFHKSDENNWNFESYIKLATFNTIEEYAVIMNTFNENHPLNAMLFVMRDDIKPMWEADENKKGGCISFKIYRNKIYDAWTQLNNYLISENILKVKDDNLKINGISISPKKTFSIIKIWFCDNTSDISKLNIMNSFKYEEAIYKEHLKE